MNHSIRYAEDVPPFPPRSLKPGYNDRSRNPPRLLKNSEALIGRACTGPEAFTGASRKTNSPQTLKFPEEIIFHYNSNLRRLGPTLLLLFWSCILHDDFLIYFVGPTSFWEVLVIHFNCIRPKKFRPVNTKWACLTSFRTRKLSASPSPLLFPFQFCRMNFHKILILIPLWTSKKLMLF